MRFELFSVTDWVATKRSAKIEWIKAGLENNFVRIQFDLNAKSRKEEEGSSWQCKSNDPKTDFEPFKSGLRRNKEKVKRMTKERRTNCER
jgi:hypothetical protein